MKKTIAIVLASLLSFQLAAHSRWVLPSHFTLSSEEGEWIMMDVTASNETFNVDKPMGSDKVMITKPDGSKSRPSSSYRGHRKSVVDFFMDDAGTYKVTNNGEPSYMTRFKLNDKRQRRWISKSDLGQLPKGATDIETRYGLARIESYITMNNPTDNFVTDGRLLELVPVTHPSDIAQEEPATFKLLFNGKAQSGVMVEITREGVRYRNDPQTITLTSNAKGEVSFTPVHAGRYLLIAEHEQKAANQKLADKDAGEVFLSFEVLLN